MIGCGKCSQGSWSKWFTDLPKRSTLKSAWCNKRYNHGIRSIPYNLVISNILGGSKIVLIGNVIEQQFRIGNWRTGSETLFIVFLLILYQYDKESRKQSVVKLLKVFK